MKDWSKHPALVVGSLLASLIAVLVSIAGYLLSADVEREQREVALEVVATTSRTVQTRSGHGILVSISNASLRPVILRGASLWLDGAKLGDVTSYLADSSVLEQWQMRPERVASTLQSPPLTLESRSGRTLGLLVGALARDRPRPAITTPASRTWARIMRYREQPDRHRLELRLDVVPGGSSAHEVVFDPAMTSRFTWQYSLAPRRRGVRIGLRLKSAEAGEAHLFVLDVWARNGPFHRRFARPLIGRNSAYILVSGMPDGRYVFSHRVDGRTAVTGCFRVPVVEFESSVCR